MIFEILIFIAILCFLVFIHELGHFSTAKYFKIGVDEFGLGIPPRLWGKKIGETIYSINWLPIGGFVQIRGENLNDYDEKDSSNFMNKKPWQQFVVLIAGITMNFLFAVIIFYITLANNGFQSKPMVFVNNYSFPFGNTVVLPNVIGSISENSPAQKAGLTYGDQIKEVSFNGESKQVSDVNELKAFINDKAGKEVDISVKNLTDGTTRSVKVTPEFNETINQPAIGVSLQEAVEIHYDTSNQKAFVGFTHAINSLAYNYNVLKMLVSFSVKTGDATPVAQSVSGPIGIFDVVSTVLNSKSNNIFYDVLDLAALISLSLALMNLLPIPALDGGRIVFVLIEWVSGKRPSAKLEARAHQIGFAFLITLIILITFKDVWQLVLQ